MKKRYKIRKSQLEMVVESFVMENNTKKGLNEFETKKQMSEGMFDKLKNKFKSKVESWLDTLEQSDDPAVQKALATVRGTAKKIDSEDIPSNIEDVNVMESILKMGNMLNEANEKGKMSKVDRTVNRIKEIGGWGTAGAAFVSAVGVLLKAAMGAGMYTLGLPVGLVVMIMLAILVPSVVLGGTSSNKRMRDKTGDIRY